MTGLEIAIVIIGAAAAAVIKSISGTGYPIVLIPVLALFLDVHDAIVITAPSNFALNAVLLWQLRRLGWGPPSLRRFLVAAVIGAVVGALLLPIMPDRALRLMLVGLVVLFMINRFGSARSGLSPEAALRFAPAAGGVAGFAQGATGVSGPVVTPWFLMQDLARSSFIHAVTIVYALSGLAQIAALGAQRSFTSELLTIGVLLVPLVLVVLPAGVWLRDRTTKEVFEWIVIGTLVASAVSILVRMF